MRGDHLDKSLFSYTSVAVKGNIKNCKYYPYEGN